jgi:hypothetical protein
MKITSITLFVFLLLCGITFAQEEKLGSEITLTEKTKISDILASPESYLDKVVLVEGEVLEVCPNMGCWMDLKSEVEGDKIKIKVKDGEIIFPVEAKGKTALVEGKVYKLDLTQEEAVEYFKHIAEESNKEFNPATVTGPMTIYQIKGLGAEIFTKEG